MDHIRRGDIYYVHESDTVGAEIASGRPAIIVSNDYCNAFSATVEVVFLTTRQKKDLPTHCSITSARYDSTAICEQISTVAKERLGDYGGFVTKKEMESVDKCICISLGLYETTISNPVDEILKELRVISSKLESKQ